MSADPVAPVTEATSGTAQDAKEIGHKVFVGNLNAEVQEEGLKAFFAPVASDIVSVQILRKSSKFRRSINPQTVYAFVALATVAAAEKAVAELHEKTLDERTITVQMARPIEEKDRQKSESRPKRRVGRRGDKAPPGEVTEAEANGEAEPADAAATNEAGAEATPKPKKNKKSRKKPRKPAANGEANGESVPAAEGESKEPADTTAAAATNGAEKTKKPKPRRARPPRTPRAEGEEPAGEPSKNLLFVANLAFSIDDAGLKEIFTAEGINVVSARVVRRRIGKNGFSRSKGYGFVDVGNEEEQKKALEKTSDKEVAGRQIAVKIAVNGGRGPESGDAAEAAAERESTPEVAIVAS